MENFEINITTFINPHCFFITEADSKHRSTFLQDVSARIKKSHVGFENSSFQVDEMVSVYYEAELVRATVVEKTCNKDTNTTIYFCWLVDYALLIQADKIFKLPKEIQKITPRAKQASLNNFCYLGEQLELGITGKIKSVPSIIPSAGVTQYCLDELLCDCSKLVFEVAERYNNILIGEVLIYKNDKVLSLTQELCNKGLITTDEVIFQRIKFTTKDYVKTNVETIHQVCKTRKVASPIPICKTSVSSRNVEKEDNETKEIDIDNMKVLENGRRRRGLRDNCLSPSQTSGSEDDQGLKQGRNKAANLKDKLKKTLTEKHNLPDREINNILKESNEMTTSHLDLPNKDVTSERTESGKVVENIKSDTPVLSRVERARKIIMEKKSPQEVKNVMEEKDDGVGSNDKGVNSSDDIVKKLKQFRLRKQNTSTCSTRSEEGFNSSYESSIEDHKNVEQQPENSKKSPFGDITSQRKTKPLGLFLPGGMEGRFNKEQQSGSARKTSREVKTEKSKYSTLNSIPSSTPDDDCPTIKIPKLSGSLTDDQISPEEGKDKSDKEKEEESSLDSSSKEIFTKQDFCRLVAGCTCIKCRMALEDDDWDTPIKFGSSGNENQAKKKKESTGPIIKPPKLLRKEVENETFIQENDILSIDYSGMSAMEKRMSCKVLVHGESIPNPIKCVAQVNIHRDIYNNINRLNYEKAKRIQHYTFPAITRNQHVFMVNDTGSGKTMAYLPILSSFIMEKEERYGQLFKMGGGPIVVILCSNSKKCEEIYDLTRLIFNRQRCRVSLVTYPGHGNISNIDILITMPTILSSLISSRATNFKRLCHFVMEDGDVVLKSHQEMVKKFLNYGDQVLHHRHCPKSIQIILCAEHWTPQIEDLLKELNKVPLVCIGNHLEAALYGKINFTMKFLDTGLKEQNLHRILQDVYKFTKSIIICNPDELEDIANFLPFKGIDFTAVTDEQEEDISYKEVSWSHGVPGKYSVLICTDAIYNTMNITNAQLLIHYSLPSSWTQFIRRFSCLLENNPTPLNIKQRKETVSTFVFIDENCEPRMSKFCNFIKIAGLEKDLPDKMKIFFQGVVLEEEYKRVAKQVELCETLRIFGKCDRVNCKKRHLLDKDLDSSDSLPKNGSIKFKILKMTNATTCSVKLLEHFDLKGQSVKKYEDFTDKISEILAKNDNYQRVSKPIGNHLYLHKDGDTYWRCKLLEMDDYALVYLIDRGIYCKSDPSRLYRMPDDLKKLSRQSYEVYLANLIPPHGDRTFSKSAKHKAQFLVDGNCPNSAMTAKVVLQLGNNLWLDDVCEVRDMHDKSLPSIGYQLTRELVKQELAVRSEKPLANLYALSKNAGIELPEYKVEKPKIKKVLAVQATPQWAFLDMEAVNQVQFSYGISPEEFYVKLQKFNEQLARLEEEIQSEIRKPFYPVPQKIEKGKCYLVKDEPTGNYSRALVLQVVDDRAHVFCVDYGDDIFVPASSLKHITNDLILKLPFQSIQCSMHGIKPIDDVWSEEATDLLYKMGFEEGSNVFRTLFVKTCSKRKNDLIAKQTSYSVLVKDGFNERHLLQNELLIDCGFAVPNGDEIEDFELPQKKEESEDDDVEEIVQNDRGVEVTVEDDLPKDYSFDEDAFDMEIFDVAKLMVDMQLPVRRIEDEKAKEDESTDNDELLPMKAAPAVDYFTPEVYWSQTDASIKLIIKVTDVQEPKISVKHNRIFQFDAEKNGKQYHLKLILYGNVEKTFQYTVIGPEVRARLTKCKTEDWARLVHTKEKTKNIHYDVSTLEDDDDKPRRLLQLDISESSSEDDEHDGMVYHVCSDLDSEYDYDIPNDVE